MSDDYPVIELSLAGVDYRLDIGRVTAEQDSRLMAETRRAGSTVSTTSLIAAVDEGHFSPSTVAALVYLARLQGGTPAPWVEIRDSITMADVIDIISAMADGAEADETDEDSDPKAFES